MAERYAYVSLGDSAWVKLGAKGIKVEITTEDKAKAGKESKRGTVWVGKAGIRWVPKGGHGDVGVRGAQLTWDQLDKIASGGP